MNKFSRILTGICAIAAISFMSSCVKDKFDAPDENIPTVDFTSNTTIAELRAMHATTGVLDTLSDDIIIEGIVVATDESGNFYKDIVIQDNTGGIEVLLDQTDIYTSFRLGQKVFIKCQGLYLGDYGGNTQLGYDYNGAIGRIPAIYIKDHLFADSLPGDAPTATVVTIPGLTSGNLDMLIQLDSVYFIEAGEIFATTEASATNRTMSDFGQKTLVLRTSMYANFAGSTIPSGVGSVRGILSVYDGTYQFYIRDLNDLINFQGQAPSYLINETFGTSGSLGTFSQYSVTGTQIWAQSGFGSDFFAKMSGYESGNYYTNEDWLISPAMDLDSYNNETLNFFTMMNYGTVGDGSLKILYSSDYTSGDPTAATWTDISSSCTLSSGAWAKAYSGDVDLSAITGSNVHLAFKYTCSTSNVATWEVGGITIIGIHN